MYSSPRKVKITFNEYTILCVISICSLNMNAGHEAPCLVGQVLELVLNSRSLCKKHPVPFIHLPSGLIPEPQVMNMKSSLSKKP